MTGVVAFITKNLPDVGVVKFRTCGSQNDFGRKKFLVKVMTLVEYVTCRIFPLASSVKVQTEAVAN